MIVELNPTGPLLGVFPCTWWTRTVRIEPGEKLVVYTDGLSEARNSARDFYGIERLAATILAMPCIEAAPVVKSCLADLHTFNSGRLSDHVTLVMVCRASPE